MAKNILITGGAGFIGVNAAVRCIERGDVVTIFDNLSRAGTSHNIAFLEKQYGSKYTFIKGDVSKDTAALEKAVSDVDAILHLAAQVAVTTSVVDPVTDFESNARGTLNVLEAARQAPQKPLVIYASTNKVYGNMSEAGINELPERYAYANLPAGISEAQPLDFHSPYGCSKGAADQYVRDYARIYDLPTAVLRQSCIYGPHQFGVEDQGWVAWFTIAALTKKPITIFGDGKQVRDVLHVDDLTRLYCALIDSPIKPSGEIYNVGGGMDFTLSLRELVKILEQETATTLAPAFADWRPGDQKVYISDIAKVKKQIGWQPTITPEQGVKQLIEWVKKNRDLFA